MTLDEARRLGFAEIRRGASPTEAAHARATEARERLVHALGLVLRPDPPMRIVEEALRRAEAYSGLLDALARALAEPVEMTPAEAAVMLSWCRPAAPKAATAAT